MHAFRNSWMDGLLDDTTWRLLSGVSLILLPTRHWWRYWRWLWPCKTYCQVSWIREEQLSHDVEVWAAEWAKQAGTSAITMVVLALTENISNLYFLSSTGSNNSSSWWRTSPLILLLSLHFFATSSKFLVEIDIWNGEKKAKTPNILFSENLCTILGFLNTICGSTPHHN